MWTGYHVRLGKSKSVLIDTAGWEKDPCFSFGQDTFKKVKGTQFNGGQMNIRKQTMVFFENEKFFGYESPENSDEFLYKIITNGRYDPTFLPMGEFFMIGKKQEA